MYDFLLPDLGEGVHEGEILKWHVKPGDHVKADDPLVDVETDKAAVTIPSPRTGTVAALGGDVGDTVHVGKVLVSIDETGGAATTTAAPAAAAAAPAAAAGGTPRGGNGARVAVPAATAPGGSPAAVAGGIATSFGGKVAAAPATRRVAREMGIDLSLVPASGPGGRVTTEDVQRFAASGARAGAAGIASGAARASGAGMAGGRGAGVAERDEGPVETFDISSAGGSAIPYFELTPLPDFEQWGPVEKEPVRSIRRKTAKRMVTSMTMIPHVGHMDDVDVTELDEFRKRYNTRRAEGGGAGMGGAHAADGGAGVGRRANLTLLAFVVRAVVEGLKEAPRFNSSLDPFKGELVYKKFYNIGIAVDSGHGLVVPVVKNADRKSILEIAQDIADLAGRAREGKLAVSDLQGGTFTITNVGPVGGTGLVPTINYPEVAILGMGKAAAKAVVRDGAIVARTMMTVTLGYDHRVNDGADGGRFVAALRARLEDPLTMLLGM